jgi:hypothetical protein
MTSCEDNILLIAVVAIFLAIAVLRIFGFVTIAARWKYMSGRNSELAGIHVNHCGASRQKIIRKACLGQERYGMNRELHEIWSLERSGDGTGVRDANIVLKLLHE